MQAVKFILIGVSSAVIYLGISYILYHMVHLGLIVSNVIAFVISVTNGFIWNSQWTFKGLGSKRREEMYIKFFAVNIIGFLFNQMIMAGMALLITRHLPSETNRLSGPVWLMSNLIATAGAFFWNFTANKLWTFKKEAEPEQKAN